MHVAAVILENTLSCFLLDPHASTGQRVTTLTEPWEKLTIASIKEKKKPGS